LPDSTRATALNRIGKPVLDSTPLNQHIVSIVAEFLFLDLTVLAGNSESRFKNAQGELACFNGPVALVMVDSHTVLVADSINSCIRSITPEGLVSSMERTGYKLRKEPANDGVVVERHGNQIWIDYSYVLPSVRSPVPKGTKFMLFEFPADAESQEWKHEITRESIRGVGFCLPPAVEDKPDAFALVARFRSPFGVTVDGHGNVYLAVDHSIQKISADGTLSTLAGNPSKSGDVDGWGEEASFSGPWGLAVDGDGNVIVADVHNFRIRRITPDGMVSTLVVLQQHGWDQPKGGVVIDGHGNIILAGSSKVYKLIAGCAPP
jgi:DNA-binding beta-propeller fold protein YncE